LFILSYCRKLGRPGYAEKNGKYLVIVRLRVLKVDEFAVAIAQELNF